MTRSAAPDRSSEGAPAPRHRLRLPAGLPRSVWMLGLVSLLMDVSSEMIESLMPVFLVGVLGLGAVSVGLVSGMAEATASLTKPLSGWVSDRIGRRKLLALIGYGLAACVKPLFAPAPSLAWVMAARFVDRVGKGIRVAPRDALLTELAPGEQRGAAFGLRKAMDSLGATLGPLLALLLMAALDDDIRLIYWLAVIPAVLCVAVLALGVREPSRAPPPDAAPSEPPSGAAAPTGGQSEIRRLGALGPRLLGFVGLTGLLQFALFSEAFMLLRAAELGLRPALVPALLIVMNLAYAIVAYVSGLFADRGARSGGGRAWLLYPGFLFLILAYGLLIAAHEPWHCFTAAVAWGVHLGMTQGVMPTIVADLAPAERRGTAFGAYHLALGVTALPAGAIAGVLWQAHGADATFLFGSGLTVFALAAFALWNLRFGKL